MGHLRHPGRVMPWASPCLCWPRSLEFTPSRILTARRLGARTQVTPRADSRQGGHLRRPHEGTSAVPRVQCPAKAPSLAVPALPGDHGGPAHARLRRLALGAQRGERSPKGRPRAPAPRPLFSVLVKLARGGGPGGSTRKGASGRGRTVSAGASDPGPCGAAVTPRAPSAESRSESPGRLPPRAPRCAAERPRGPASGGSRTSRRPRAQAPRGCGPAGLLAAS